ncbi:MAG TPA: hypothetical protein VMU19_09565, partial [Bryobacteraceae bacterium]|nr:hypothetical protein [Bryobacteraceae bacterium]
SPSSVPATSGAASATTGFAPAAVFSIYLGQDVTRYIGGELRYSYILGDARIQSAGTTATFGAISHEVHYDVTVHTSNKNRVQLFAAAGAGIRLFIGNGQEEAYQPLMQFAYLTKTRAVKPMGSVGGGLKFRLAKAVSFRVEVRDYISPFPTEVITPAMGATFGKSLMHDLVPMAGLAFRL